MVTSLLVTLRDP